jgi:DNA-binding NtrC family response regulator
MNEMSSNLLGNSPEFLRVLHAARMVAGTDATVVLHGEPGTGKERMAREIHTVSRRRERPFVAIGCAGTAVSELEQAAQQSAAAVPGQGGTLFLKEVAELSTEAQTWLLHFLDSRDAGRSGQPDLRVIASSSQDLQARVDAGALREDLFYRLYVVPIELPPLRERQDDVVLLLKQLTVERAAFHGRRAPRYSVTARNLLKSYAWPGNVRELRNFCERMVILMAGNMVQPDNLPLEMRRGSAQQGKQSRFVLPAEGIDLLALEGEMIRQALGMTGGNRSKAARLLGISRDTLLYRIQKHAIGS